MAATTSLLAYDIRVSLMHIQPEIWRLIRVPADIRMDRLHDVLQVALGWTDSHLHQFHLIDAKGATKAYVGRPDPDFEGRTPTQDETKRLLKNFLTKPGDRIGYEYDFGDSWRHEIKLTAVHAQSARLSTPLCMDGARACPPEDCGGVPGFEHALAASANPKRAGKDLLEWLGDYDPMAFDLAAVNRALARRRV
jgi:Plasmid pRiA4b ORF-3-like protein